MDAPILRVVLQRHDADCAVACLAMICGVSYENALVAIAQVAPNVCAVGINLKDLQRAARHLGFSLRCRRNVDVEADTGVLNVCKRGWKHDHLVVLREGLIIETDGLLWEQSTYFAAHDARPGSLMVAERLAKRC